MSPGVLERNDDKVVATKITGDRGPSVGPKPRPRLLRPLDQVSSSQVADDAEP